METPTLLNPYTAQLKNGDIFQTYYGGQLIDGKKMPEQLKRLPRFGGSFSLLRNYLLLEVVQTNGATWIKSSNRDGGDTTYLSTDGRYKVANYGDRFYLFKCSTHREGMRSTFGNYALPRGKEGHPSFEAAAEALHVSILI